MGIKGIIAGWSGLAFGNDKMKPIAKERALLCSTCPKNRNNWCVSCGCNLSAKTMSPFDSCPKGHWSKLDDPESYL